MAVTLPKPPKKKPTSPYADLPVEGGTGVGGGATAGKTGNPNVEALPGQGAEGAGEQTGLSPIDQTYTDLAALYGPKFQQAVMEHAARQAFTPDAIAPAVKTGFLPYEEAKKRLDLAQNSPADTFDPLDTGSDLYLGGVGKEAVQLASGALGALVTAGYGVGRLVHADTAKPGGGLYDAYHTYEEMKAAHPEMWLTQIGTDIALGHAFGGMLGLAGLAKWKTVAASFAFGYATTPEESSFGKWRWINGALWGLGGFAQKAGVKAAEDTVPNAEKSVPVEAPGAGEAGGEAAGAGAPGTPPGTPPGGPAPAGAGAAMGAEGAAAGATGGPTFPLRVGEAAEAVNDGLKQAGYVVERDGVVDLGIGKAVAGEAQAAQALDEAARTGNLLLGGGAADAALNEAARIRVAFYGPASSAAAPDAAELSTLFRDGMTVMARLAVFPSSAEAGAYMREIYVSGKALLVAAREGGNVARAAKEYARAIDCARDLVYRTTGLEFANVIPPQEMKAMWQGADQLADGVLGIDRTQLLHPIAEIVDDFKSLPPAERRQFGNYIIAINDALRDHSDSVSVLNAILQFDAARGVGNAATHEGLVIAGAQRAEAALAKLAAMQGRVGEETAGFLQIEKEAGTIALWRWRATGSDAAGTALGKFLRFAETLPEDESAARALLDARAVARQSRDYKLLNNIVNNVSRVPPPDHSAALARYLDNLSDWIEEVKTAGMNDAAIADELLLQAKRLDKLTFLPQAKEIAERLRASVLVKE